jgi:hypothetical protein
MGRHLLWITTGRYVNVNVEAPESPDQPDQIGSFPGKDEMIEGAKKLAR